MAPPPPPKVESTTEALDPSKFPGGLIPTKAPPRRLGGRVRTGR